MPDTSPTPAPPQQPDFSVILGLGANLGEPREQLRSALRELGSRLGLPVRVAGLYQSAPLGPAQPDFLNTAALLSFPGDLLDLLDLTQAVELELGRVRAEHWGPRTIDIDLLWAAGRAYQGPRLQVPHLELESRAFALLPLLELYPSATSPRGLAYADLLPGFHSQRIERIAGPGWEQVNEQSSTK